MLHTRCKCPHTKTIFCGHWGTRKVFTQTPPLLWHGRDMYPRLESCSVLVTRASTRQHKKILISGTIGAFRSGRRVANMAVLSPGTVMKSSGERPPTENTVSSDTVLCTRGGGGGVAVVTLPR